MKKRILSILLSLCVVLALFPAGNVLAADPTQVNTPQALFEAIENGESVKLTDDIPIATDPYDAPLVITQTLSIDLNGFTLSGQEPSNVNDVIQINGEGITVTIQDSSALKNGKITSTDNGTSPCVVRVLQGALILENGTITTEGLTVAAQGVFVGADASFTMLGGKVEATRGSGYSMAVNVRGNDAAFTMNGGEISCARGNAVSLGGNNTTFEMTNGEITGEGRDAVTSSGRNVDMDIRGGSITSADGKNALVSGQNGSLTISGGDFTGGLNVRTPNKATITAGTFNGESLAEQTIEITTSSLSLWVGKTVKTSLAAKAGTIANAPLNWTLADSSNPLPDGLTLNADGSFSGAATQAGSGTITVQASPKDGIGKAPVTKEISYTITHAAPIVTTESLPVAYKDIAYTAKLAADSSLPITAWALHRTSDPLPEGLTLNADGTITGTPVATGTVDKLRVTATSDAGTSSYRTLTLEVMLAAPEITTQYLPDAVVGQAYSNQLEATGSGEIKWSIQDVDALPDGLTFSDDGLIAGTPVASARATFTVVAENDAGSVEKTFALAVYEETEATITFRIENGTWADGTKDPKHVTVLLRDGKGTLAKDEIPTGMKPDAGFAEGAWDTEPETAKDAIASDLTYTFVFEKAQTAPETPEDPETPSIPGTGDMHGAVLWSVLALGAAAAATGVVLLVKRKAATK